MDKATLEITAIVSGVIFLLNAIAAVTIFGIYDNYIILALTFMQVVMILSLALFLYAMYVRFIGLPKKIRS